MITNLAATKTNLFKIKKALVMTEEGHELLDEKRKILMNEMTRILHIVDKVQTDVNSSLKIAYGIADKAIVTTGRQKLEELSLAIDISHSLSISERRIMGVGVPVIDLRTTEHPPYYSPYEVNFYIDETIVRFKDVLKLLADLAEKKIALLRIAREVQKTMRKVNALEKIHLPYYRSAMKSINDRLDEESRESFSMSKLIKERLKQQVR